MPETDRIVLIIAMPSAPPFNALAAGTVGLPTFGVIFAHTGSTATSFTQPQTSSTMSGFSPIAMPILRSGKPCGHDRLSSKPSTPVSWTSLTICCQASLRYSSMIDATRILVG